MARKLFGIVGIFLAFYLAAHFYIRWKNTVTDDVTKIGRLVECQPNDAHAIAITQAVDGRSEDLLFERVDQPEPGVPALMAAARWEWRMKAPTAGVADPSILRRVASTLCELYDPIPVRAEDYGVETSPRRLARKVEVTLADNKKVSVEFGALVDRATVIRYRGFGKERTVRIPDRFLETVSLSPQDFRNMRVMRTEADNVQRMQLSLDGKERFTIERAGADWKVLLGGKEKGDGSEAAEKFLNRISTLRAIGLESENFSGKDCAALKFRASVAVLDIVGHEEQVRFDYGPAGNLIACSTQGTQKFRVHRDLLPFLDVSLKSVLAK